ncbi:hypothetical protein TNCV_3234451 [Trichonephila clavipes]|nr:hypothetical protein TNCV_3234451 [Trichonephila clavipes]
MLRGLLSPVNQWPVETQRLDIHANRNPECIRGVRNELPHPNRVVEGQSVENTLENGYIAPTSQLTYSKLMK